MRCQQCLDKWGQEPSMWGDSPEELAAYFEHVEQHVDTDSDTVVE